ncbi:MAG TPA: glycosyltransferase [Solirubrobacterales bacterium]|nr:glycosyltransferase [Solirubrobacterales bacterium]
MRIALLNRRVMPEGGVSLAAFRLAQALTEAGHEAEVLYTEGEPPAELAAISRRLSAGEGDGISATAVSRELERLDPALVLVGSGKLSDLLAAAAVAPAVLHAHMHNGVCADNARYWSRLRRPCPVRAGWHCAMLRPAMGCANLKRTLDPGHVVAQRELLAALIGDGVGVLCVSTDQACLFAEHGVDPSQTAVLPNLGIVAEPERLAALSRETPPEWRDATAFFGRLSKAKGVQLLPPLAAALPASARLRIFGDGYLAPRLSGLPAGTLCGHVAQDAVTGVLMWARAAVFPSLWPEPGGIVGVDAQVIGVPLAAFDVGAARFWPAAQRFPRGDVAAMAAWLGGQTPRSRARDPEAVAAAQRGYRERVGRRAAAALESFARERSFGPLEPAVAEELIPAPLASVG